jgi:predicted HicB family RNase H-like nuclease
MSAANDILAEGKRLAQKSNTWADLSNALFDPLDGLVAERFPGSADRAAFRKSAAYAKLHKLVEQKMQQTGVVAGSEPTKSGRFVVRLPKTLHAALEREALTEGTSLNQLVLAKLAARLSSLVTGGTASLIQAFGEVRDGFSADRVVADPDLDRKFLRRCRELGLAGTDYELNWSLLNARKNRLLSDLPRTKRYTVRETDEFEYASELSVRHLQLTKGVSLDQIICDPDLAREFDEYAMRLAPGYEPLEYRWVALGLRKAGRLQKDKADTMKIPDLRPLRSVRRLELSSLPRANGLYLFSSEDKPVFLSHTDNLRHRIERHMEVSSARGLPEWLWDRGPLDLSLAEMPGILRASRQTAELLLVRKLHPLLNFQRSAA